MSVLDNRSYSKQLDQGNYLSNLLDSPEQLLYGFDIVDSVPIPALYAQAKQVLCLVSPELTPLAASLQALMLDYCRIPFILSNDYQIPAWVSKETLVLAVDYSGTTEQVLLAYREATKHTNRLLAISVGGELLKEARRVRAPHIAIDYGAQARIAFYHILGILVHVCRKLDFAEIKEATVNEAAALARSLLQNIGPDVPEYQNNAKQLASKIINHRTLIVGSGALAATAKRWQFSLASTGKLMALSSTLNEFNDTIINGVRTGSKGVDTPLVIMLQSKYDHQRNKLQQTLTYQVAQVQKVLYEQIFMHPSGSQLGEIVLCSLLGDVVSYYAALLKNSDPSVVEATTFIREKLAGEHLFE